MPKLYCKNCKHYGTHHGDYTIPRCLINRTSLFTEYEIDYRGEKHATWRNHDLFYKLFNDPASATNQDVDNMERNCYANKEYNCPLYYRKWWKFGVKEKRGPYHLLVELMKDENKK